MNTNLLLAVSVLMVGTILLSINYTAIIDFYTYSVPLVKTEIIPNFPPNQNEFEKVKNETNSTCYTTPSENQFCYQMPKFYGDDRDHLTSFIVGDNGINGELHFDRVGVDGGIFTIKNMTLIDKTSASITFADKDYRIGNKARTTYEIIEDFEFIAVVDKYDSFITHCGNFDGSSATLVQYLGTTTIDNVNYFLTWHTVILPEDRFSCKYPEIIQHSLGHNFRDL